MSDLPPARSSPPSSSLSPTSGSTPRRKRPWTILGRLSKAVREQNWFAVVLELAIVVLGVVIGFQVTGWGQARADAAKERAYLHQLIDDLLETETEVERMHGAWKRQGASAGKLLRPYRSSSRPPVDSVLRWMNHINYMNLPTYVTGTATALVETGDLNLIRNDSLRSSITRYLGRIERQIGYDAANSERWRTHLTTLSGRVDMAEAALSVYPPGFSDSLARADPEWPVPEAPLQAFAPLDVEAFYRDREVYTELQNIVHRMYSMRGGMTEVLAATVALREQIEAELDR